MYSPLSLSLTPVFGIHFQCYNTTGTFYFMTSILLVVCMHVHVCIQLSLYKYPDALYTPIKTSFSRKI